MELNEDLLWCWYTDILRNNDDEDDCENDCDYRSSIDCEIEARKRGDM